MQSCIDGIGVSCPKRCAYSWSSDVPTRTSDPSVCVRVHVREEDGAGAEVIAADLLGDHRLGLPHVGVGDDGQVLAVLLERVEGGGGEVEPLPRRGGRPEVELGPQGVAAGGAVHHLDRHQARAVGRGLPPQRAPRRDHRVEERERHRGAHAVQERPARKGLGRKGSKHVSVSARERGQSLVLTAALATDTRLARNASLATTPLTKSAKRYPLAAASLEMRRIAGMS
jgi:hypothetical protein